MACDILSLAGRGACRQLLGVVGSERIGPYTLLRLERGELEPGIPGQFFMLEAPGRLLPRPMSLCQAPSGELAFLIEPVGPGTRALCALQPGEAIHVLGPLGNGFDLDVGRPLLVAGGIGLAPMPYLSAVLGEPPALLGFRSESHVEAASLLHGAEVVVEPRLVTELLPGDPGDVLACGPQPMLEALRARVPASQLAWEAPMACGYGGCYGCVVEVDDRYVRLCVEGPVLRGGTRGSPTNSPFNRAAPISGSGAFARQSPASPANRGTQVDGNRR
jgi:dihydroorotate dehydrogenase electron transfer subunit